MSVEVCLEHNDFPYVCREIITTVSVVVVCKTEKKNTYGYKKKRKNKIFYKYEKSVHILTNSRRHMHAGPRGEAQGQAGGRVGEE